MMPHQVQAAAGECRKLQVAESKGPSCSASLGHGAVLLRNERIKAEADVPAQHARQSRV